MCIPLFTCYSRAAKIVVNLRDVSINASEHIISHVNQDCHKVHTNTGLGQQGRPERIQVYLEQLD